MIRYLPESAKQPNPLKTIVQPGVFKHSRIRLDPVSRTLPPGNNAGQNRVKTARTDCGACRVYFRRKSIPQNSFSPPPPPSIWIHGGYVIA